MARFDNDRDIFLELVETYLEMGAPDFPGMKAQLAAGDANRVMQQVHKLKGGALTIGADELSVAANGLETFLKSDATLVQKTGPEGNSRLETVERLWNEMYADLVSIREELRKTT
jgi:HPt (histidine-containing phosphotransfer) domain-containing protein